MGFSPGDCEKALEATKGRLDEAATWLTQYAEPTTTSSKKAAEKEKDKDGFKISGFEVRVLVFNDESTISLFTRVPAISDVLSRLSQKVVGDLSGVSGIRHKPLGYGTWGVELNFIFTGFTPSLFLWTQSVRVRIILGLGQDSWQ